MLDETAQVLVYVRQRTWLSLDRGSAGHVISLRGCAGARNTMAHHLARLLLKDFRAGGGFVTARPINHRPGFSNIEVPKQADCAGF
jgi:hypothetical protein